MHHPFCFSPAGQPAVPMCSAVLAENEFLPRCKTYAPASAIVLRPAGRCSCVSLRAGEAANVFGVEVFPLLPVLGNFVPRHFVVSGQHSALRRIVPSDSHMPTPTCRLHPFVGRTSKSISGWAERPGRNASKTRAPSSDGNLWNGNRSAGTIKKTERLNKMTDSLFLCFTMARRSAQKGLPPCPLHDPNTMGTDQSQHLRLIDLYDKRDWLTNN